MFIDIFSTMAIFSTYPYSNTLLIVSYAGAQNRLQSRGVRSIMRLHLVFKYNVPPSPCNAEGGHGHFFLR